MELAFKRYPSIFGNNEDNLLEFNNKDEGSITPNNNDHNNKKACIELIDHEKPLDKDLIILSTVRSNKDGKLGIMKDPRILNSVLTKSRRGVIIIGNMKNLLANSSWRDFIYWAQSEGLIMNYN